MSITKTKKITNIQDLTEDLISTYEKVKSGSIDTNVVKDLSKTANNIIKSAKLNLDYNKHTKSKNKIKFLETK